MKTERDIQDKINKIDKHINFLIDYIFVKIETKDWHAVEDAASDIRDLEAEKKALTWIQTN